ncbi:E3 ubiquitin-protein ligase TRIM39-like [Lissotriton helveticus]
MAAVDPILTLKEEFTCPICLDYFDDPVITVCGHNFCQLCLARSWRDLESDFSCPQCLTVFARKILLPNRQLRNVVELAKQLNTNKEATKELLCEQHKEPLKLFCQEDQKLICVVCDRSRDHRSHIVHPIEEAAQECRGKLLDRLIPLKENLQLILVSKLKEDNAYRSTMGELRNQRENILAAFEELEQFLEQEKQHILKHLETEKKEKLRMIRGRMTGMLKQQSIFRKLITEMEEKCKQQDIELLKDVQSVMDRCDTVNIRKPDIRYLGRESTLECFNTQLSYLNDKIKTIKEYFRKELEFSRFKGFKVPIVLDPDTAHPKLVVSKDWTRVRWTNSMQSLPGRSKRFSTICAVVGTEGFSSGRHYWEVQLKHKGEMWAVGVMAESVNRKGESVWTPQRGIWSIGAKLHQYNAFDKSVIKLYPRDKPSKLGVYLDYEKGRVSMYNADTMEHLFLFFRYTFTEKLFPFFVLSSGSDMHLV